MKQTCIVVQKSNMSSRETDSPRFAAGVAPGVLGYVLSRMRLAVESKETGRYEPALICCWWIGPGKKRKLEKDDPMLVLATHSKICSWRGVPNVLVCTLSFTARHALLDD